MNYIHQINAFWDKVSNDKDLKPTSIVVYLALLQINNKAGWKETFTAPIIVTLNMVSINPKTYYSALDELSERGYIKYKKGPNQHISAVFALPVLYQNLEEQGNSNGSPLGIATGLTTEEQGNSNGNIPKPVNSKLETNTNKKQSKQSLPPVNEIFIFFEKNSVDKKWRVQFCKEKADKFFETYKDNPPLDWRVTAKNWILTEKNPRTIDKTSDGRSFPEFYSREFMLSLSADNLREDRDQYRSFLDMQSLEYKGTDKFGKAIWGPKLEPLNNTTANSEAEIKLSDRADELSKKLSNPEVKPKIVLPSPTGPTII